MGFHGASGSRGSGQEFCSRSLFSALKAGYDHCKWAWHMYILQNGSLTCEYGYIQRATLAYSAWLQGGGVGSKSSFRNKLIRMNDIQNTYRGFEGIERVKRELNQALAVSKLDRIIMSRT